MTCLAKNDPHVSLEWCIDGDERETLYAEQIIGNLREYCVSSCVWAERISEMRITAIYALMKEIWKTFDIQIISLTI